MNWKHFKRRRNDNKNEQEGTENDTELEISGSDIHTLPDLAIENIIQISISKYPLMRYKLQMATI